MERHVAHAGRDLNRNRCWVLAHQGDGCVSLLASTMVGGVKQGRLDLKGTGTGSLDMGWRKPAEGTSHRDDGMAQNDRWRYGSG
eukprot:scaffold44419_cov24-Tisochrysis_lutea.AAC.2